MLPSITTGLQKTNGGKGRPLEYIMLPISEVAEILGIELTADRIFRAVDENIIHEVQSICDQCDHLRTIIHTIYTSIQKFDDFFQEDEITRVNTQEQSSVHLVRNIRRRIGDMLVAVRSGTAQSSQFDQLLVELESQLTIFTNQTKQFERGDINTKLQYAIELKNKGVIAVREPESLAIIQHRHPKSQLIILYTDNELRTSSKDKWVTVYFDFLQRIEASVAEKTRLVFCYFDYDLHPNFQPQSKNLEVREYLSASTARIRPKAVERSLTNPGVDTLVRINEFIFDDFIERFSSKMPVVLQRISSSNGIEMRKFVWKKHSRNRVVEFSLPMLRHSHLVMLSSKNSDRIRRIFSFSVDLKSENRHSNPFLPIQSSFPINQNLILKRNFLSSNNILSKVLI